VRYLYSDQKRKEHISLREGASENKLKDAAFFNLGEKINPGEMK
jgi:hypothetical protein